MSHWNRNRTNEKFINPERERGQVILNGAIDKHIVALGSPACNRTPMHKLAEGQLRERRDKVERGDLIYTYVNATNQLSVMDCNSFLNRAASDRATGVSVINGQGIKGAKPEVMMQQVVILGLAEMPNDENDKEVFNIATGGIYNVRNNGDETINANEIVIGYWPSPAEVARGTNGGQTRTPGEKQGEVKLWFKPYRDSIHKDQPKQIYECLLDENHEQPYLPAYRKHCRAYLDSVLGSSLICMQHMLPQLQALLEASNGTLTAEDWTELLRRMGHSEFAASETWTNNDREEYDLLRDDLLAKLFMPFSMYKRRREDPRLFAGDKLTQMQTNLNAIQVKAPSQFIHSSRYFIKELDRHVVGQALSTAAPGKDFTIQLKTYSR